MNDIEKRLTKLESLAKWKALVIIPPPLPEAVDWQAIENDHTPPPPVFTP